MSNTYGISWNGSTDHRRVAGLASALTLALAVTSITFATARSSAEMISVIVRERPGAGAQPEQTIEQLRGRVGRHISIIDGFEAAVPSDSVEQLRRLPGVLSVTRNAPIRLLHTIDGYDASSDPNSVYSLRSIVKADQAYRSGFTGAGVDVALIDSGVVPVNGLTAPGKIVNGPDLSFESQSSSLRYVDTFGHGTHMAGIIAGSDDVLYGEPGKRIAGNHDDFSGIAPDARILSIKVANETGATDVSQVLAAIDWVVQHRTSGGLNIRVLNLSFGTDGVQDYELDPLTYAVEVAWRRGIVVVVAAGNNGKATGQLNNPAYDPRIIAVGAADTLNTPSTADDVIPSWSSEGDGLRNPDLVAPGRSVASLRAPGSYADRAHPEGRINSRFFRGSGTSQAAAMTSGAVALLLQQRPGLTPDQVKAILKSTANPLPAADTRAQGAGLIDVGAALRATTPLVAAQPFPLATGTGSLDRSRGSARVVMDGVVLSGEQDIFGEAWNGDPWSEASWSGASWSGGTWNGSEWTGASWSGVSWSGASWSGASWSGASWSGASWSGASWSGASWSGASWSGASWSGASWSGASWSGASWSGASWS
ncbi:MAG TPA: S8 family serine peptidase [Actinomycetota bacterium]